MDKKPSEKQSEKNKCNHRCEKNADTSSKPKRTGIRKTIELHENGSVFVNLPAISPILFSEPEFGLRLEIRMRGNAIIKLKNGNMPDNKDAENIKILLKNSCEQALTELGSKGVKTEQLPEHLSDLITLVSEFFKVSEFELITIAVNAISTSKESSDRLNTMRSIVSPKHAFA